MHLFDPPPTTTLATVLCPLWTPFHHHLARSQEANNDDGMVSGGRTRRGAATYEKSLGPGGLGPCVSGPSFFPYEKRFDFIEIVCIYSYRVEGAVRGN